jgi:rhodanese-related sulfurtransferase
MRKAARYLLPAALAAALGLGGAAPAKAGHDDEEPTNLVAPDQVKRLMDIGEEIAFIDLRTGAEFATGRLPDARSIPVAELVKRWKEIPNSGRVILYCPCPQADRDESFAFLLLRTEHYRNVSVLDGGYTEWVKRGYPIQKGSP